MLLHFTRQIVCMHTKQTDRRLMQYTSYIGSFSMDGMFVADQVKETDSDVTVRPRISASNKRPRYHIQLDRDLVFCLSLYLLAYFVRDSSECSGESAHLHRLVCV